MNVKQLFILFFTSVSLFAYSQDEVTILDPRVNPGQIIEEFETKEEIAEIQEYYFDEVWLLSDIRLKNGITIKEIQAKYDLLNNQLELKTDNGIKICPPHIIDEFVLINPLKKDSALFVDIKTYDFYDGIPLVGFFEIIKSGKYALAAYHNVEIQHSSYIAALDMGRKNERTIQKERYFVLEDQKVLCELENNTKKMDCPELQNHLPAGFKMKTRSLQDKIAFIDYLNKLPE